jgi:tryptophanase
MELVRLAFPRRVYTQSHVDYLGEVILHVNSIRHRLRGLKFTQAPVVLRHFTAKFEPVGGTLICADQR